MAVTIQIATSEHLKYAQIICELIETSAKQRGTGIAKRQPEYIERKMNEGKAVIALEGDVVAGFCYIESWEDKKFVANSGLIVNPDYRGHGLGKKIKTKAFELSRQKFLDAKLFGITTSLPVMKINSELGYKPVTFSELTQDPIFWEGCKSCPNYDILVRNNFKNCLCTGMLYDPKKPNVNSVEEREEKVNKFYRWVRMKKHSFLKAFNHVKILS